MASFDFSQPGTGDMGILSGLQGLGGADVPQYDPSGLVQSRRRLDPNLIAALISGGAGVGQSIFSSNANAAQQNANRQLTQGQLLSQLGGDQSNDMFRRQALALQASQMDPVSQQRDLFSASLLGDLGAHGPTQVGVGGVQNRFTPSAQTQNFVTNDALSGAASRFYENVGRVDPTASTPDLAGMGFGSAGADKQHEMEGHILDSAQRYDQLNKQRRQDLLNSIAQQQDQAKQGHSSIWKKILAGGALAGAAFIPGLQAAAPWAASALLGAGIGSATGGLGGALSGAASGAMNGGQDYFNRRIGG